MTPARLHCTLVPDFLSMTECRGLIARLEAAGIGTTAALYPPSYRDNDRLVLDDAALAAALYPRIERHAPERITDETGSWRRVGLNPRFRCCRYRDGQRFAIHRDGVHHESPDERSGLTFMIYLNDASEFEGGATRYYTSRSGDELLRAVTPAAGAAIVFDHALWHDGQAVTRGTKYVLRSDVMYRREEAAPQPSGEPGQHLGYIWSVLSLGDGTLASSGRDRTVRIWSPGGTGFVEQQILRGHASSVSCLAQMSGALFSGDRQGMLRRWVRRAGSWDASDAARVGDGALLSLTQVPTRGREQLASGSADGVIRLFAADPLAPLSQACELRGHRGWIWSLVATEQSLWSGGEDGTLRRWDLPTAASVAAVQLAAPIHSLARDGERLFVGCADGTIELRDATSLRPHGPQPLSRQAHAGAVRALSILPSGRIASGGEDDTVALWDADLSELARHGHADFVRALALLPDGSLVSGSYDGTLARWPGDVK